MTRSILVVRPQPSADQTVALLQAKGLIARAMPLFEIAPLGWDVGDAARFEAVMLTSANAVRHAGPQLERLCGLPAYAVGAATGEAAKASGFRSVWSGDDDVVSLAARIAADGYVRVLHLCGETIRTFDPGPLTVDRRSTYAARAIDPPCKFQESLTEDPAILLHSPRAAARLASLCSDRSGIAIIAISANAAKAAGTGWQKVAVAANKRDEAMIEMAVQVCGLENGNPR